VREQATLFGESGSLVGIVTDPPKLEASNKLPAMILLNFGLYHRVGPNRLHVKVARRLASMGLVVLRFDFSGIGDSLVTTQSPDFQNRWIQETQEAMDWLSRTRGINKFLLGGICSGAITSFETACRDPRVVGTLLINPNFRKDKDLDYYVLSRRLWKVILFSPRSWLKLLGGKVKYRESITRLIRGSLIKKSRVISTVNELQGNIRSFVERGVNLLMVCSSWDPGMSYLELILGDAANELVASGKLRLETIQHADHTFTPLQSQGHLLDVVENWVHSLVQSELYQDRLQYS